MKQRWMKEAVALSYTKTVDKTAEDLRSNRISPREAIRRLGDAIEESFDDTETANSLRRGTAD